MLKGRAKNFYLLFMALLPMLCGLPSLANAETALRNLPVPVRGIRVGEILRAENFYQKEFKVNGVAEKNFAMQFSQLENMQAMRPLPANKPIALIAVRKQFNVVKGQRVKASFAGDGIAIESYLVVLQNGIVGQEIDAKNPSTGAIVRGLVLPNGELQIELGP